MIRLDQQFITPPGDATDLGQRLHGRLVLRSSRYRKALKRCRKKFSEKAVHALRVEIRKMLSLLTLLEALLPRELLEPIQSDLKNRLKALSRLRDTHVQIAAVETLLEKAPDLQPFLHWLQRKERRLTNRLEAKLEHAQAVKGLGKLTRALKEARINAPARAKLLRAAERAFRDVVVRQQRIDPANTATIHRTRLAFKKFRYMIENLDLSNVGPVQLQALRDYQTRMGKIQDVDMLLARAEKFAKHGEPDAFPVFRRGLLRRRARLIVNFIAISGKLFTFWPLPGVGAPEGRAIPSSRKSTQRFDSDR